MQQITDIYLKLLKQKERFTYDDILRECNNDYLIAEFIESVIRDSPYIEVDPLYYKT